MHKRELRKRAPDKDVLQSMDVPRPRRRLRGAGSMAA
jgi:hypothetical protein